MKVISFSLPVVLVMQGLVYSQDLRPVVEHGQSVFALNAIGAPVLMDTPPVSSRPTNAYIAQGANVKAEVTNVVWASNHVFASACVMEPRSKVTSVKLMTVHSRLRTKKVES